MRDKQSEDEKFFFSHGSVWENKLYNIDDTVVSFPEIQDRRDLAELLQEKTKNFFDQHPKIDKPNNFDLNANTLNNLVRNLKRYLFENAQRNSGPYYGWKLKETHPNFSYLITRKNRRSDSNKKIQEFLTHDSIWINDKHNLKEKIFGFSKNNPNKPKTFRNSENLAKYLMSLIPEKEKDRSDSTIKIMISNIILGYQNEFKGWHI